VTWSNSLPLLCLKPPHQGKVEVIIIVLLAPEELLLGQSVGMNVKHLAKSLAPFRFSVTVSYLLFPGYKES
jgi:hypothetical protein